MSQSAPDSLPEHSIPKFDNDPAQGTQSASSRQTTGSDAAIGYDVAVIGAGLGGLAACIFLGQAGLSIVCVEPEAFPHARVGESFDWSMPSILQALGLPSEQLVEEQIATYKHNIKIVVVDEPSWTAGPVEQLSKKPLGFEVTTIHIDRRALDQRLFDIAREQGTAFIWDRVSDIEITDERVVACQTGSGRRIAADWFLDASGQARLFAKAFEIPKVEYGHPKVCLWTYFKATPYHDGTTLFADIFASEYLRWVWDIPITPETTSVGFVTTAEWIREQRRDSKTVHQILRDELAQYPRFGPLLLQQPDFEVLTRSFRSYVQRRACGPNWLLVGEAASMPDPLTANGATSACRHAKEATQFIRDSLERGALSKRQKYVYNTNVWRMGHAYNRSIERAIYEWPMRWGLGIRLALPIYAAFGYLVNALYSKFQPQGRLSMVVFGILFSCVWLGMEGWSLAGKAAFLVRRPFVKG